MVVMDDALDVKKWFGVGGVRRWWWKWR